MVMPARRLWLLRHAQPLIASGICYGHLDVPADTDATRRAAHAFVDAFLASSASSSRLVPERSNRPPIPIYVSGLQRARQLAEEVCLALHPRTGLGAAIVEINLQTDSRLNEMDFGIWEGKAWSAIPKTAIEQWSADFARHKFGGKESCQEVIERVLAAYQATFERAHANQSSDVIWITHAGVIRAVRYLQANGLRAIENAEAWPREAPGFGDYLCVDLCVDLVMLQPTN